MQSKENTPSRWSLLSSGGFMRWEGALLAPQHSDGAKEGWRPEGTAIYFRPQTVLEEVGIGVWGYGERKVGRG